MFAPIYVCPIHGETWHAQNVEIIDCENDDVFWVTLCDQTGCSCEVKPLMHEGHPVVHPLTEEEAYWESYSDEDEE